MSLYTRLSDEGGWGDVFYAFSKASVCNNWTNNVGEHTYRGIGTASNWLKELNNIITTLYSNLSIQEAKEKKNINKK